MSRDGRPSEDRGRGYGRDQDGERRSFGSDRGGYERRDDRSQGRGRDGERSYQSSGRGGYRSGDRDSRGGDDRGYQSSGRGGYRSGDRNSRGGGERGYQSRDDRGGRGYEASDRGGYRSNDRDSSGRERRGYGARDARPERREDRGGFSRPDRSDRPQQRDRYDNPDRGQRGGYERRDERPGRDRFERREERAPLHPGLQAKDGEPATPSDVDLSVLPFPVRAELRGLTAELAQIVGAHLVAAGELIDEDPQLALAHAQAARRRAARLPIVREATAETAYAAGDYATALTEYRALRRMTGGADYLPVLADCERALGRPENALKLAKEAREERLSPEMVIEMTLVEAGARDDLGQRAEALRVLKNAIAGKVGGKHAQSRLRYAYADLLERAGDEETAKRWFTSSAGLDPEQELDAEERVARLEGLVLEVGEDDKDLPEDDVDRETADDASDVEEGDEDEPDDKDGLDDSGDSDEDPDDEVDEPSDEELHGE